MSDAAEESKASLITKMRQLGNKPVQAFIGGGLGLSTAAVIWLTSTFETKANHTREVDQVKADQVRQEERVEKKLDEIQRTQNIILLRLPRR